ncbi:T9SS type A sorting domain-containing protein, partial [Trichormus sp. NMC-1]|uniref:T9SS type A sorting domain-containing protein n=1 Tax=Trichormus sp. NMC-1 TaxID=1853259 RepID=UPI001F2AF589
SSINSAQPSVRANWDMPLNRGIANPAQPKLYLLQENDKIMKYIIALMLCLFHFFTNAQEWDRLYGILNNHSNKNIYSKILAIDAEKNIYFMFSDDFNSSGDNVSFNEFSFQSIGLNDIYIGKLNNFDKIEWIIQTGGDNTSMNDLLFDDVSSALFSELENALYLTGLSDAFNLYVNNTIVLNSNSKGLNFLMKISSSGEVSYTKSLKGTNSKIRYQDINSNLYLTGENYTPIDMPFAGLVKGAWIAKIDSNGNTITVKQPFKGNLDFFENNDISINYKSIVQKDSFLYVTGYVYDDTLYYNENDYINFGYSMQTSTFKFDLDLNYLNNYVKRIRHPESFYIFNNYPENFEYSLIGISNNDSTFNYENIYPNNGLSLGNYNLNVNNDIISIALKNFNFSVFLRKPEYSANTNSFYFIGENYSNSTTAEIDNYKIPRLNKEVNFLFRFSKDGKIEGIRLIPNGFSLFINQIYVNDGYIYYTSTFRNELQLGKHIINSNQWNWNCFIGRIPEFKGILMNNNRLDEKRLLLYPNPSNGICNVIMPVDLMLEAELLLSINTSDGRLIKQYEIIPFDGNYEIDISNLSNGIYYLSLKSKNQFYYGKLMKSE